jgi:regulatory GntR family protein
MAKRPSMLVVVQEALRRAILEQALEPGAKLPEDAVGEQFGVSRTIARRALERLAAEELGEHAKSWGPVNFWTLSSGPLARRRRCGEAGLAGETCCRDRRTSDRDRGGSNRKGGLGGS